MFRQARHYLKITDHPLFKAAGCFVTLLIFVISYYYLSFRTEIGIDSSVGLLLPGVVVLIWEAAKQRNVWIFWLIGVLLCLVGVTLMDGHTTTLLVIAHIYWVMSFGVCLISIMICSRSERRHRERISESRFVEEPIVDPIKDEFLEKLFASDDEE